MQEICANTNAHLASVVGRYFAMDRDKRWERVKKAYDLLLKGTGTHTQNLTQAMQASYDAGTTDEFIEPIALGTQEEITAGRIQPDDVVIFFNFRTDRGRQLTQALSQEAFPEQGMKPLPLYYVTLTNYDESFKGVKVVYEKENIEQTLGEVLQEAGKKQIRIAETENTHTLPFSLTEGEKNLSMGRNAFYALRPK